MKAGPKTLAVGPGDLLSRNIELEGMKRPRSGLLTTAQEFYSERRPPVLQGMASQRQCIYSKYNLRHRYYSSLINESNTLIHREL